MFLQIEDYLVYCNTKGLSKKTIKSYEQTLKLFERYCVDKNIKSFNKVTSKTVTEYIDYTKERGKYTAVSNDITLSSNNPENREDYGKRISPLTINSYIRNLKAFYSYSQEFELTKNNPMSKIKQLPHTRKQKEFITDAQFRILIQSFNLSSFSEYRDFTITNLLMDTGMRISECLLIKLEDIDLKKQSIFLPFENTKSKKGRFVYFSQQMNIILKRWLKYKDVYTNSKFIFTNQRGNPIINSVFESNFRKYCSRINLENVSPNFRTFKCFNYRKSLP